MNKQIKIFILTIVVLLVIGVLLSLYESGVISISLKPKYKFKEFTEEEKQEAAKKKFEELKKELKERPPVRKPAVSKKTRVTYADEKFLYAVSGESWEILDDNITVMKNTEIYQDRAEFINNILTVLGKGEKVDIIKTKGFGSQWKYCRVKGIYYGWILAETVDSARKVR